MGLARNDGQREREICFSPWSRSRLQAAAVSRHDRAANRQSHFPYARLGRVERQKQLGRANIGNERRQRNARLVTGTKYGVLQFRFGRGGWLRLLRHAWRLARGGQKC